MSNTTYYVPNESETVLSGAILDYDDFMLVSSGGTALNTTVNSGGTMCCILGGSAIGTVLNHGRMWLDTSSGIAQDTVVNSGADFTIYSGCMASNTTVNDGGFIDVESYGKADGVTVASGGSFRVYFTASATGVEMEEGATLQLYMDPYTVLTGTSGGKELSVSNGTVDGLTIESGGILYASGYTTVSNTTVKQGGYLAVYDKAVGIIEDGGYVNVSSAHSATFTAHEFKDVAVNGSAATVHSGTTATNTTIGSGGEMFVYKGGLVNSAAVTGDYISSGSSSSFSSGLLQLYSGASADSVTAGSGGLVRIANGATVTNLTENGGGFEFAEGFDMSGVNFLSNSFGGQTLSGLVTVHSGTTATDITLDGNYCWFHLYEGGSAFNVTVGGYFGAFIHSGAVISGLNGLATIEKDAVVYDLNGRASVLGTVSGGTVTGLNVSSGGRAVSVAVNNSVTVFGGTLENAVINSSAWGSAVGSGTTLNNLTIAEGGFFEIRSGVTADGVKVDGGMLGIFGGTVTNLAYGENGALNLLVDPTAEILVSGTGTDGTPFLLSDGRIEHFNLGRGSMYLSSGGLANDIAISGGGIQVNSGCTASGITAAGSATVFVHGGTLTNAVISGGPSSYYTYSGATLSLTYDGTADDITLEGGRLIMDGAKTKLQNVKVNSGSIDALYGMIENARITGGGSMRVIQNATASGTVLSASKVSSGSGESAYVYDAGGKLFVSSGGTAIDTEVGSACVFSAQADCTVSGTVVKNGGLMSLYWTVVNSHGDVDDVTVQSGGSISILQNVSATNLKLENGAKTTLYVTPGTNVQGTYAGSAFEVKDGLMTADFPVLENNFVLVVSSGGVLNLDKETTIGNGGALEIYDGGTVGGVEQLTLDEGGRLYGNIGSGVRIRENGGYVDDYGYYNYDYMPNTFTGVTLTSWQSATVHSGTVASKTLIRVNRDDPHASSYYDALMRVFNGGVAIDTEVDGGYLGISSGGVASNTLVCSSAVMELDSYNGASAINTTVRDGGILWFNGGRYGSTVISKTTVSSGGTCRIGAASTETTAADTVVSSGGTLCIAPYYGTATMIDTVVEDGLLIVSGGGSSTGVIMSGTVFKGGVSQVFDYTYASGYNHTFSALDTTLDSGAHVTLSSGSSVDGVYAKISYDGVQLKEKAVLEIDGGVYVDNVSATEAGATVRVLSGGSASNALIGNGAILEIAGDAEGCMAESGGTVRVLSRGNVLGAAIGSGASMTLAPGAEATGVMIDGGTMRVTGSGLHDDFLFDTGVLVTIVQNGTVTVESGACLNIVSAGAGGRVEVGSDAVVTEMVLLTDGGEMHVEEGGQIFFIMNYMAAPSTRLLANDLSRITGAPDYRLVVKSNQTRGTYVFASGAADFDGTITVVDGDVQELGKLKLNETVKIGDNNYTLRQANGNLGVTITDVTGIEVSRGDIDKSGISDVLFQWTGGGYQLGYWMNGRSVEGGESTWKCTGMTHSKDWEVLGNYVMDGDGNADTVLVGNVEPAPGFKGAYIGYYKDGVDLDENWVTIGYLTNDNNIEWKNKVGNLTGNADANSILWYAPELYALGVWKDGREDWQMISSHFGGDDWTLAGCGDFDGDGKDSVVMSYANGLGFYSVELDGSVTSMGGLNWAGWEIRAIGDFSGDRKDDVVLFHKDTGSMVLLADGNLDSYTSIGQLDPEDWFVVGAGDYNGDQKDDLLVRQYSTGTLGYYVCADQSKWTELGNGVSMDWTVIA